MSVKISVTVDDDVLAAARDLAPGGNHSAMINDAKTGLSASRLRPWTCALARHAGELLAQTGSRSTLDAIVIATTRRSPAPR